jgi:hypothetical protein
MSVKLPEPIRVTEVLSYFKEPWYIDWVCRVGKAEANKTGKRAMKIGSRVDELIKEGKEPVAKDCDEVKTAYSAFVKWRSLYTPLSLEPGVRLFKQIEEVEVTGEPDLFVDGVLIDIKCATKISKSYWIQVNMYRMLHGSTGRVGILRLDKTSGSFEYVVKEHDPFMCVLWVGMMRTMLYLKGDVENDGDEL